MTAAFDDSHIRSIGDIQTFLDAADVFGVTATCPSRERAGWIRERLLRFRYSHLSKREKGIVLRYLLAVTGLTERAVKEHIAAYKRGKTLCAPYIRRRFPVTYTDQDRELLAETDNAHGRLNGQATREILNAMFESGDERFIRLRHISNGHLYTLRSSPRYRDRSLTYEKTKSVQIPIGAREKPVPDGQPGFIRVDTVHQGDRDGEKGVYHVNLVDEVTQWEVLIAVPEIAETCLEGALGIVLECFPFVLVNFHSDNGSEYINKTVASLLEKLLIRQTKSRPRHSTDNGLIESKNGSIVRKHMGYWHIPKKWASRINRFYQDHLIPYVNFHRPSAFPTVTVDPKTGRKTIAYRTYRTPLQALLSLPERERFLKPGITVALLNAQGAEKTPNQAAEEMQEAKRRLFRLIEEDLKGGNAS